MIGKERIIVYLLLGKEYCRYELGFDGNWGFCIGLGSE